jgi:ligand-binding sensor domain-containing protein
MKKPVYVISVMLLWLLFACSPTASAPAVVSEAVTVMETPGITITIRVNTSLPAGPTSTQAPAKRERPATNTVTPWISKTPSPTPVPEWKLVKGHVNANQTRILLFDQNGFLWAGGPWGVTKWNTQSGAAETYLFLSIEEPSRVIAMAQAQSGTIWVGTSRNGVSSYKDGHWETFTRTKEGLPSNYIADMSVIGEDLYLQTSGGDRRFIFGKFDGVKWTTLQKADESSWYHQFNKLLTLDQHRLAGLHSIYFGGIISSYIAEYDVTRPDAGWNILKSGKIFYETMTVAPDGALWVADRDGLHIYKESRWTKLVPPWIGSDAAVSSIAFHPNGNVWFGLSVRGVLDDKCGFRSVYNEELGVYRYDGVTWKQFTTDDGLIDDKICDIAIGPDGDIWFGSYDQGISRYDGTQWTTYVIAEE